MTVSTAQKLHKIMAGPVGTMAAGAVTAIMLLAAGFLTAVVMLGTITTPGNPTRTPDPVATPPAPVCYRLTDDTCSEGTWVNVDDVPADPYAECLYWVTDVPQRIGRIGFAPEVCEGVGQQRG